MLSQELRSNGFTMFWSERIYRKKRSMMFLALKKSGAMKNASKPELKHKSVQFMVMLCSRLRRQKSFAECRIQDKTKNMAGCNQNQERLTENACLDFKYTYYRDVISVQSNLVPSFARGRKQELETRLQENKQTLCTIYLLNQSWESVQLRKIHQAIRQWLSTAGCIFTLKPRFIYFLLGFLNNLFGQNLYWLSTSEYEIRETTRCYEQLELFLDSRARGSSPRESPRYTRQDDLVSRNKREDFFPNAVYCQLIADSTPWFHDFRF